MVEILETSFVVPSEETPKKGLWLSNLDVAATRGHTPTVYFFRSNGDPDFFPAEAVKAALAKALVPFYPMAGRLGVDRDGRPEIDCNAEGAVFVLARSDQHTVDSFKDFEPSPEMRRLFVPAIDSADPPCPILFLQLTVLKCGGRLPLHPNMGGAGPRGEAAAGLSPPFHDRTLLRARTPPAVLFDHPEYAPSAFPPRAPGPCVTTILKLSREQVAFLKARCVTPGGFVSTFRAVAAHVWRSMCVARGLAADAETRLFLPAEVRGHLRPPLPPHYFGNALVRVSAQARVGDIVAGPIGFAAERIKSAVDRVSDEYARSLARMPMYEADFGWGAPQFMARAQTYGSGFVYLTSSPGKDAGISVVLGLEPDIMKQFKKLFYQEFCPLQA
uniref:Shikimate O-hydroxycinnamoyltransferase n=1 Tax=Ananas comosus var. bracteatus TaxID=296719 RepID=A0A6V7P455_ANACO|nr:unnamed protein product [Ananas comosus var. bracteatus]